MESGRSGRKSEIEKLRKELDLLNRSMEEVDGSIEEDDSVRIYAGEVREVANLIEGVVDEYDLMTVKQRSYLKKAIVLIRKLIGRDDLGRDIKNIKALLVDVRVKGEASGIRELRRDAVVDHHHRRFVSAPDEELVGMEKAVADLKNGFLLGEEPRRSAVSLIGMGGSGKTTLAGKIFNNDAVKKHFDIRCWMVVPYGCIEAEQILRLMATQNGVSVEDGVCVEAVRESLRGKRYLIVFDDVWTESLWGVARDFLPDDGVGSRVIVTTRSTGVARSFTEGPFDRVYQVAHLTTEMSFELFCRTAFRLEFEGRCPVELQEVSFKIVDLCKGSPLLIRVVAGLLSTKPKVPEEWWRLLENLSMDERQDELYLKGVSLAFDDLPPQLKKCFMYFSVFAEKPLIQSEKLIRLWITEGFIQEAGGKTLEEVAEEYLEELLGRNLVEASNEFYGINKFFRAHDLIHDLVRMKATNRDFCVVDDGNSSISSLERKCRRITISSSGSLQKRLNTVKVKESWVRSVFLRNTGPLGSSVLVGLFKKYYLLTMFDMENSRLEILPKEVGNLSCLKYLSLKNTGVKKLPKTIGALYRLEVLNLSGSLLVELPTEITKLGSLRHLLASYADIDVAGRDSAKGVKIKEGIGAVGNLQTLTTVDAKLSGMNVIQELKKLNQLRSLKVTRLTSELAGALSDCIGEMSHLKSLHLESMKNEILDVQNVPCPPIKLQYLVLKGELRCIPDWIPYLENLRITCFSLSNLVDDPLPSLRLLPKLEYLWLYGAYRGPRLVFHDGFEKLKLLVLREMWGLESIEISDGATPLLEELRIGPSPLLEEVPAGIARLNCLEVVSFYDMPDEFVLSLQPDDGLEFPKIEHVPSVLFCYRNAAGRGYISYKLGGPDLLRRLNDADTETGGGQLQDPRLSFSFSDDEGDTSDANFQRENVAQSSFRSDMLSFFSDDIED